MTIMVIEGVGLETWYAIVWYGIAGGDYDGRGGGVACDGSWWLW